jgi:hypothetical protein
MEVKMPLSRMRLLKEVNAIEMSDIDIGNKVDFFKYYRPAGSADMLETSANKLSMNDGGTTIYATGINGTHTLDVLGGKI